MNYLKILYNFHNKISVVVNWNFRCIFKTLLTEECDLFFKK